MFGFFEAFFSSVFFLISYVSNSNAFPKPLSDSEEAECIKKMKNGDLEARNKLIEHNLRLVAHIAKKYAKCAEDGEELISIGTIGLIKGIMSYDESKGTRLATYAARCIENELLMLMRSNKKSQNDVSLNDPIGTDKEGNQILLVDVMSTEEEVSDIIELKAQVKKLKENILSELDDRERKIITERYGLDGKKPLTQREIAKKLDISRSYISRIEKRAVQKLKKGIADKKIHILLSKTLLKINITKIIIIKIKLIMGGFVL